jgi:hypothetical protein
VAATAARKGLRGSLFLPQTVSLRRVSHGSRSGIGSRVSDPYGRSVRQVGSGVRACVPRLVPELTTAFKSVAGDDKALLQRALAEVAYRMHYELTWWPRWSVYGRALGLVGWLTAFVRDSALGICVTASYVVNGASAVS